MRLAPLVLALLPLPAAAWGQAQQPAAQEFQAEFSNPGLSPAHWILTIHPDGSGHFRSEMGSPPSGELQQIDTPGVDRDMQVSAAFAQSVFDMAQQHKHFNESCESHLKVAFQGWKTLSYSGPDGKGSCKFNYSKDKQIEALGDSLDAVAQTILEGARLETLLQHDKLGLDQEMQFLVEAADNGRAQQICAIREILERLAQDDGVLDRVRKRAKMLLSKASA